MATGPEPLPQVAGEGPDVGAAGAPHGETHLVTRDLVHPDLVDAHRPRLELHLFAGPDPVVGPLSVDLDRRDGRRHLFDLADEAGQRLPDRGFGDVVRRSGRRHLTLGVVGGRRHAQAHRGVVRLVGEQQVTEQPGRTVDAEHQHPGRHRVERAGVADLARAGESSYAGYDVVGGHAARLVDDDETARRVGHRLGHSS